VTLSDAPVGACVPTRPNAEDMLGMPNRSRRDTCPYRRNAVTKYPITLMPAITPIPVNAINAVWELTNAP